MTFVHLLSGLVSAAVVLAAFGTAVRLLARRPGRPGYPRPRYGYRGRGRATGLAWRAARAGVVVAGRLAAGAPLGRRRTDATFISAGTRQLAGVPGWHARARPGRWAYRPGWQRATLRWAAAATAFGLLTRPLLTVAAAGGAGAAAGVVLAVRWPHLRYERRVLRPVYLQLCGYLGTEPGDRAGRWLAIPRGPADGAAVTLAYPPGWNPDAGRQRGIDEVVRRHRGAGLAVTWGPGLASWRHPPAPPASAPFDGRALPAHRVHLATLAGGRKWVADLQNEEPHLLVAAGTGGGKTATVGMVAAHVRAHGWLVDIIDPKRRSYIDRRTGADVLTNVPGIRVHTSIDAMLWALEEYFLSMLGVNIAVGDRTAWPAAFPQRLLVIDEFGTFAGMAARDWHRAGGRGPLPALDQRRQLEWQGRQAGHRLVVAVHQPNLRLFDDSDSRAQYGFRVITGAYSTSLWRMTFGYAPPVEWNARVKGRGAVGIGEAPSLIHHAQVTHLSASDRRAYALTGPPPPAWHAHGQPAPWITPHVITEGQKLAGVSLVTVPPVPVPPGQRVPLPAVTPSAVPPWDTPAAVPAATAAPVTESDGGDLVIGITAAAAYLGYDKPDSFRRARTRHPVPGETRTRDGRPAWPPAALTVWHPARHGHGTQENGT